MRVLDPAVAHVLDDAHDGLPLDVTKTPSSKLRLRPVGVEPLAEGALARPAATRQALAHDHDLGRVRGVVLGEDAARDEPRADGAEVVGRRGLPVHAGGVGDHGRAVERLALDEHPAVRPIGPYSRGRLCTAPAASTPGSAASRSTRARESALLDDRRVLLGSEVDREAERVVGHEAQLDLQELRRGCGP